MPIEDVQILVKWANYSARAGVHACNGDRHTFCPLPWPAEKETHANWWDSDQKNWDLAIKALVAQYGFTDVVHNSIVPTLMRGEQFIEVPF